MAPVVVANGNNGHKANDSDDDDLADLLQTSGSKSGEQVPLKNNKNKKQQENYYSHTGGAGLCTLISAHISYLCFAYPHYCGCLACVVSLVIVTVLVTSLVNPTQQFGVVKHDWTSVNSVYELDVGKIDHWCLGGGNEGCRCEDPLVPVSRVEIRSWNEAFKDNVRQIEKYMEDPLYMADLDVAIIGESAIEEMDGRWMGRRPDDELRNIGTIFKNHFSKTRGAKVEGVALGIAGDAANNVLWRLLHGEMPADFEPKVWWVSVGMNDLTRQQCSEEVVVLGVLRVVEEILRKRPKARVVINSLLPMADLRGGTVIKEQDYRDAFSTYGGKRTRNSATRYVRKKINGREVIVPVNNLEEKKDKNKSSSDDHKHKHHHHRRLLEMALENYSSKRNDNSDEINYLQDMLKQDMRSFSEKGDIDLVNDGEITDHHVQRYLGLDPLEGEEKVKEDGPSPKRRARDQYNPTINKEKHEQRKYSFFRKRRMPLWTSIFAINKQLWKFCEKHDRVDFFDATNIFAEKKLHDSGSEKYFTLLSEMISARGHPTELGYLTWEDEMVKRLLKILEEMKRDSPELFMSTPPPAENVPGLGKGGSAAQSGTFGGQGAANRDNDSGTTETAAVERIEKKPVINDKRGHVTKTLGQDAQYDQKGGISDSDDEATENKNEEGDEDKETDDDETQNDANNGQARPQVEQVSASQPQAQQGYGGMQQQGGMQQGGANAGGNPEQQQQQYGAAAGYSQQQQQYGGAPQQQYGGAPQMGQQPEYGMQGGDQIQRKPSKGGSQMGGTQGSPVQGSSQQQPRPRGNYQRPQRGADAYGQAGYPNSGSQRQPPAGMQGGNRGWQNPSGFQGGDSGTSGYQGGYQQQQGPPRSFQSGGGVGGQAGGGNVRAQPQAGYQQDGGASIGGQQQDEETADEGEGGDDDDTPTGEANQGPALETGQAAEGDGGGDDDDTPAEEADQGPALKNDNAEGEDNDGGNDDDNTPANNDAGDVGPIESAEGGNDEDQGGDDNEGKDDGGNADNTQREEEDNDEDGGEGGNDNAPEDEGGNDENAQEDEGGNDNADEGGEDGDGAGDDDNN